MDDEDDIVDYGKNKTNVRVVRPEYHSLIERKDLRLASLKSSPHKAVSSQSPSNTQFRDDENTQVAAVARSRLEIDRPRPEGGSPNITGRYEAFYLSGGDVDVEVPADQDASFVIQINQAGRHFEAWAADVVDGSFAEHRRLWHLAGDFKPDLGDIGSDFQDLQGLQGFSIENSITSGEDNLRDAVGCIFFTRNFLYVRRKEPETTYFLRKIEDRPTLSETAIDFYPVGFRHIVKRIELFPLTRRQIAKIREYLNGDELYGLLNSFFSIRSGQGPGSYGRIRQHSIALEIDSFFGDHVFAHGPANKWHSDDVPLVEYYAKITMSQLPVTLFVNGETETHTLVDWLYRLQYESSRTIHALEEHLGIQSTLTGYEDFKYEVNFVRIGLKMGRFIWGGGVWGGRLRVRRLDFREGAVDRSNDENWEEVWENDFWFMFGEVHQGVDFSISRFFPKEYSNRGFDPIFSALDMEGTSGEAFSRIPWDEEDFGGVISLVTFISASAGVGPAGSAGITSLCIFGDGSMAPLVVDLSGFAVTKSLGISVQQEFGLGWLFSANGFAGAEPTTVIPRLRPIDASASSGTSVHFDLGSSLLKRSARQDLRVLAAKELYSFNRHGSILTITGHADRVDSRKFNLVLTAYRCINVHQALIDILGLSLNIRGQANRMDIPDGDDFIDIANTKRFHEEIMLDSLPISEDKRPIEEILAEANVYITDENDMVRKFGFGELGAFDHGDADRQANPRFRRVDIRLNSRLVMNLHVWDNQDQEQNRQIGSD